MKTETIVMCVVALLLGMLLANMLKNVCGCKVVEGNLTMPKVNPPENYTIDDIKNMVPPKYKHYLEGEYAQQIVDMINLKAAHTPEEMNKIYLYYVNSGLKDTGKAPYTYDQIDNMAKDETKHRDLANLIEQGKNKLGVTKLPGGKIIEGCPPCLVLAGTAAGAALEAFSAACIPPSGPLIDCDGDGE